MKIDFFDFLKKSFFDMSIADIIRAIRGGSLIGAFTQSMCSIDAMAYLYNALPLEGNRKNFEQWVSDFIVPLNKNCNPQILYAIRCGLVHTYGYSERMKQVRMGGVQYTHNNTKLHWHQKEPGVYILNLESLIAEVTIAASIFFQKLKSIYLSDPDKEKVIIRRVQLLNYLHIRIYRIQKGKLEYTTGYRMKKRFADMDEALASLDRKRPPKVKTIEKAIQEIYKSENIQKDKSTILSFLYYTRESLGIIVKNIRYIIPEQEKVLKLIKETWKDIEAAILSAKAKIDKDDYDFNMLKEVGLSGIQLELKYQIFKQGYEMLYWHSKDAQKRTRKEKKSLWLNIKKALSGKLIKPIDNILDSLSIVLPALHAVKEFKDTLDTLIQ